MKAYVYVIEEDATFLVGRKTLENWGSLFNTMRNVLETEIKGDKKDYKMMSTRISYYGAMLETLKENGVMYLEETKKI